MNKETDLQAKEHSLYPWVCLKDTTYLDIFLKTDNKGSLSTKLYDKRDDLNFPITNFPFICGNIPALPAYGVYISQHI